MMERYDKYRDSGVEWIGEIPEEWSVKKLKYVVSKIGSGVTPKGGANVYQLSGIPLLRSQNIHFDGFKMDDVAYIDENVHESMANSKVQLGDVLLNITGASIGRCFYADDNLGEANVNQHVCIVRPTSEIATSYLYFFFRSDVGKKQIDVEQTGSGREGLNFETLNNFLIPYTPFTEQTAIANYLDRKTAEIDALIAQKERLIALYEEEKAAIINQAVTKGIDSAVGVPLVGTLEQGNHKGLPLRDSGIDWLGEIPEGWEVKKLKYLGKIKYGLGQPPRQKNDGLPLIRATNIFRGKIDNSDLVYIDPEDVPYDRDPVLKENDIVVVRSGAYTGDSAIIPKHYEGAITGYDMVFRASDFFNPVFISYCLLSNYVLYNQLLYHSLRAAQPHLNREELGETLILLPEDIDEQTAIVQHIETETARIDAKIAKTQRIIELQKEYRTALISEVVTGKIKVPS